MVSTRLHTWPTVEESNGYRILLLRKQTHKMDSMLAPVIIRDSRLELWKRIDFVLFRTPF